MQSKTYDDSGIQWAWDATSLTLADTCLRKYFYVIQQGWHSKLLSVHLRFGAVYATALEHYYKHIALGATKDEALLLVVREALELTWDRNEDGTGAPWDSDDPNKNRPNLIRSIIWYADTFENEQITVIKKSDGTPAVEYSFALPVDNDIIFAGHIDRMVEYAHNPYVMDQKTTKRAVTARYFDEFKPDMQMSMYTFAGNIIYNLPVKGVIIDAAQVMVGFTRFERGFTFRSQPELQEWYDSVMYTIEAAQKAVREQHFPMRPSSCFNYGGCPFRGVCSRSPDVRPNFLAADFEQTPRWDPLRTR